MEVFDQMANQNGTPSLADLDLTGIDGAEHLVQQQAADNAGGGVVEPSEPVNYDNILGGDNPAIPGDGTPVVTDPQLQQQVEAEPGADPWAEVYTLVPEPLHQELRPFTDDFSRRYEQLREQVAPFEPWVKQGVTPGDIELALNLQQALLNNPRAYYEAIGSQYGFTPQQQQQQAPAQPQPGQQQTAGFADLFELDEQGQQAGDLDPRVAAVLRAQEQRIAELDSRTGSFLQNQQAEVARSQGRAMMDQELAGLEAKYGAFDKQEVVRRAYANAATGNPSLTNAFHQMKEYEMGVMRKLAAQRPAAPVVVGQGSGQQAPQTPDLSTEEGRQRAALALAIQLGANPNVVQ